MVSSVLHNKSPKTTDDHKHRRPFFFKFVTKYKWLAQQERMFTRFAATIYLLLQLQWLSLYAFVLKVEVSNFRLLLSQWRPLWWTNILLSVCIEPDILWFRKMHPAELESNLFSCISRLEFKLPSFMSKYRHQTRKHLNHINRNGKICFLNGQCSLDPKIDRHLDR